MTQDESAAAEPSTRRRRWPWITAGAVVGGVAAFYVGGGLYFSDVLDDRALDGATLRAATLAIEADVEIVSWSGDTGSTEGTVVLRPLVDDLGVELDGIQGLRWEGGYGRIEPVGSEERRQAGGEIVRSLALVSGRPPSPGGVAELDVRVYPIDPDDSGLALRRVDVPGPLGDYPAWFATAPGETWAIVVHGNSLSLADGLRMVPIFTDAGYPTLVATYRNDPGAPEDPSGKLRYGLTEWRDLEAMVRYALDRGSDGVVLDGYSMGAGIVMAFLQRSALAGDVRAAILDAPMLDFSATVDDNAAREPLPVVGAPLPSSLTAVAKWIAARRFGVDWDELDYLEDRRRYDVPFLVFHGTEDTTVPVGTSRTFARLMPARVELIECPAEHIGCWNVDPDGYASAVGGFLGELQAR